MAGIKRDRLAGGQIPCLDCTIGSDHHGAVAFSPQDEATLGTEHVLEATPLGVHLHTISRR